MRAPLIAFGLAVALALASPAFACGVCVEDKIASCYDHGVVTAAKARGHAVAFFAIHGDLPHDAALHTAMRRDVEGARGVDPGTARVSLENGALSFAYDPRRTSLKAVQRVIARKMAARKLEVELLQVIGT